ncbi:MAG: NAD(+) synthase [Pseudomonadota bacterium]
MAITADTFLNIYHQGFVRVGAAAPQIALSNPAENAARTLELAREASASHHALVVFPELGLTGYTNDDLFFQDALLDATLDAIALIRKESLNLLPVLLVGAPLQVQGLLYNVAIAIHRGKILGVAPKTYLPTYREFYEKRQFAIGADCSHREISLCGDTAPFGVDLLFAASDFPDFTFFTEICEDGWMPTPPSSYGALGGAHILANLSASNVTIGKADYRHALCRVHSQRCFAAYLYAAAGAGESTTDLAWDGHVMIYENGSLLAETDRFARAAQLASADIDVEMLRQERARHGSFADAMRLEGKPLRRVEFEAAPSKSGDVGFMRHVSRFPYVPDDAEKLDTLCYEAYNIQVAGLVQRLEASGHQKLVIGVSGGIDSTQALLVACRAIDLLGLPRTNILAYTLPAFATSDQTKTSAWALMKALGVSAEEIDMEPVSRQTLADIKHPFADGKEQYDVAFENVQAGARTATLFRLANMHNALVLGTGDLSELALGWCTYGVGDHMSHYGVNSSVSKTLIQHLIRWIAANDIFGPEASAVALRVLDTEISPELVPGEEDADAPSQLTEAVVGPYDLQDFNLYYITRHSLKPSKVAFLAWRAWASARSGDWPPNLPEDARKEYDFATIRKWLRVFLHRFFATSQFKRSALPNGPKVASGGSLSPRGDWRAPSDGSATIWLEELERNTPSALS